jgi:hypothetical protein
VSGKNRGQHNSQYLNPLIKILRAYFGSINTTYIRIIILADNLDQTWDAKHRLDIQTDMILSLLEIQDTIRKLLSENRRQQFEIRRVVFLRKDIFDYILSTVNEPDKFTAMSHEINWENYPALLKRVIDDRFKHILNLTTPQEVEKTWREYFDLAYDRHPFNVIEEIITKRPRDLIYFVSRLFESAINRGSQKVGIDDLRNAIESYTKFLNSNLIAETMAEYPEVSTILARLQEHHGKTMEYKVLSSILDEFKYDANRKDAFVSALFEKNYMVGYDEKTKTPFADIETLRRKLQERKYIFFTNTVYVICHAKYYYIRHKAFSSF